MRCERVPALVIVGFVPHDAGQAGFATGRVHGVDSTPPTPAAVELDDVDDENDGSDAEQNALDEVE